MAKIPKFESLDEAAEFWDTHDFEDYVDDTEPAAIHVRIPRRKKILAIPLELKLYQQLEGLAAAQGVGVEKLVAAWLKEKAMAKSR